MPFGEEFVSEPCEGDIDADGHEGCDDQGAYICSYLKSILELMIIWPRPPRPARKNSSETMALDDGEAGRDAQAGKQRWRRDGSSLDQDGAPVGPLQPERG